MKPRVEVACRFATNKGGFAEIGSLVDAGAMLRGEADTIVSRSGAAIEWGTAQLLMGAAG